MQQQSECYLHSRWKGPHFWHRIHRYRTREGRPYMMRGHQVNRRMISSSFKMMMQRWRMPNSGGPFKSRTRRSKTCHSMWRGPNGSSSIWSRGTNSVRTSMRSWSCKVSMRIDKLPSKGGSSSLPWSKRSTMTLSHG